MLWAGKKREQSIFKSRGSRAAQLRQIIIGALASLYMPVSARVRASVGEEFVIVAASPFHANFVIFSTVLVTILDQRVGFPSGAAGFF